MSPFEHAIARYLDALRVRGMSERTALDRRGALGAFAAWCTERGVEAPGEVTRAAVLRYQRHLFYWRAERGRRAGKGLSLASQRNRLTPLKSFFRYLVRENQTAHNPASDLDLPRLPQRLPRAILSSSEVAAALACALASPHGLRQRALLEVLYGSGIRRAEAASLDLYDVDLEQRTLTVREGKGGKDRLVPLSEPACAWLDAYVRELRPTLLIDAGEPALFVNDEGSRYNPWRLGDLVKDVLLAAGVTKPGACHLFRHTMATQMLDNGADLRFIQAMLGHADISTTTIYTRVSLAKLREVYERTHPANARTPATELEGEGEDMQASLLAALDAEAQDEARELEARTGAA